MKVCAGPNPRPLCMAKTGVPSTPCKVHGLRGGATIGGNLSLGLGEELRAVDARSWSPRLPSTTDALRFSPRNFARFIGEVLNAAENSSREGHVPWTHLLGCRGIPISRSADDARATLCSRKS